MVRSTRLAWGVLGLATGETGPMTRVGIRAKHPMAKSSTMKGPRGLASDFDRRRCRTANASHRWVGMSLYILHAEIAACRRKRGSGGSQGPAMRRPGAKAPSDVNGRKKAIDNLGRTTAAGFATRCMAMSAMCFKRRSLGECLKYKARISSSASDLQGSGNGVCGLQVVLGPNAARKGATSVSSSNGDPPGGGQWTHAWAPSRHG